MGCFRSSVCVLGSISKALWAVLSFQLPLGGAVDLRRALQDFWAVQCPWSSPWAVWAGVKLWAKAELPVLPEGLWEGPAFPRGTEGHCCPQTSQTPPALARLPPHDRHLLHTQEVPAGHVLLTLSFLDHWSSMTPPGLISEPLLGCLCPPRPSSSRQELPDTHTHPNPAQAGILPTGLSSLGSLSQI